MDNDEPEQEIVEAFTALLKAPENARKEFRKLVRWVLEEKRKFLPNVGSSKEQEEFNEEKKRLISLVIYLNKLTSQYNDISLQASFYDVAISAFIAGINLGQYSEPINIVKKELRTRNADDMREAKLKKLAPIIDRRKELLRGQGYDLEVAAKKPKKFYKQFMKVCAEKGIESVTIKTFQRDVQDIVKECHKKLDTL